MNNFLSILRPFNEQILIKKHNVIPKKLLESYLKSSSISNTLASKLFEAFSFISNSFILEENR